MWGGSAVYSLRRPTTYDLRVYDSTAVRMVLRVYLKFNPGFTPYHAITDERSSIRSIVRLFARLSTPRYSTHGFACVYVCVCTFAIGSVSHFTELSEVLRHSVGTGE